MQSQLPILIFAQSARFIAQIAARTGYTVWVADCFCDLDTQAVAERCIQLPALSELSQDALSDQLTKLTQGQKCHLICGTGIEQFYPLLDKLPGHILPVGNSTKTLSQLRQARTFFPLLDKLQLNYPDISYDAPAAPLRSWLLKTLDGFGGSHIRPAAKSQTSATDYYQQHLNGLCGSVCFIANGHNARILSYNRQINQPASFQLQHIVTPLILVPALQVYLLQAVDRLTAATGLKGLCSLDFIVDNTDTIYLLEVNPRISASAELIADKHELFEWHMQACQGHLPLRIDEPGKTVRMLSYLFAEQDCVIADKLNWPEQSHDLPVAGTLISTHAPVCTIISEAENMDQCLQQFNRTACQISQNLYQSA
ncbi:ATP-grasp domain-containing protein [Methylophaga sp. OBS4]|uniref:ATP-grasp domain-containing protein n=1 Tax=Methylophaga sp. OBS4 TaxID=2991935 RepID=UPI002255004F|nr:ATP-grasp domain-containing protein [Methylophaga sp. OBS4]MCX4188129.1 ATP-grasp domain-containing protein [Methylophaga sp. OBS4]